MSCLFDFAGSAGAHDAPHALNQNTSLSSSEARTAPPFRGAARSLTSNGT